MDKKTIYLIEEAYKILEEFKMPTESFSDAIIRFVDWAEQTGKTPKQSS